MSNTPWVNGPDGNTPVNADRMNSIQDDLTANTQAIAAEVLRALTQEGVLLQLISGITPTAGGSGPTSGLSVVPVGDGSYIAIPFGSVTIAPDVSDSDVLDFTPADPVTVTDNGNDTFGVTV